jgi:hypothetical protein
MAAIEYKTTTLGTWRTTPKDDMIEGDTVTMRVTPTPTTYAWSMIGRPEQSDAASSGNAGPDYLPANTFGGVGGATGANPTFTVDSDNFGSDEYMAGTYVIQCVIDAGLATEETLRISLARLYDEGGLVYSPRNSAYEAFRIPGHLEIGGDGGGDKIDDWSFMLERLYIAAMLLRDFRVGIETTATSAQALSWTRPLMSTSYVPLVIAVQNTPTGPFQITDITINSTTQFTVTFTANATSVDLYWAAILLKDA